MAVEYGSAYAVATKGRRIQTGIEAGEGRVLSQPSAITASSITLALTGVGSQITTAKAAYREFDRYNPDAFTFTSAISSPVVGNTISITGLTENKTYEVTTFGFDDDGFISEPGNIMRIIATTITLAMRDMCRNIKNVFVTDYNNELDDVRLSRSMTATNLPDVASNSFFDVAKTVTNQWPYITVAAQETESTEKVGTGSGGGIV